MAVEAVAITPAGRRRRRILDHFRAAHAVTPYDTILYTPPPDLQGTFAALIDARLIRREGQAYYWLDQQVLDAAIDRRRRAQVPVVVTIAVALALVTMLFYRG